MNNNPTPDPTHGLSVQQADALWDAVAIPGPQEPTFPVQHERVCRAVAGTLDELAPAVPSVSAVGQTTRDRIAEALYAHDHPGHLVPLNETGMEAAYRESADAVLPLPADRAAVLLEVADWLKVWRPEFFERWAVAEQDRYEDGVDDAADELRRLAAEAQQQPGPRCTCQFIAESWIKMDHAADCPARPGVEAQQQPDTETEPESCAHCGKTIRRITGTLTEWWVHVPGGQAMCQPWQPARSTRATPRPAAGARQDGPQTEAESPRTVCVCGHTKGEHIRIGGPFGQGRLLCDSCDPDSTENLACKEFEAL